MAACVQTLGITYADVVKKSRPSCPTVILSRPSSPSKTHSGIYMYASPATQNNQTTARLSRLNDECYMGLQTGDGISSKNIWQLDDFVSGLKTYPGQKDTSSPETSPEELKGEGCKACQQNRKIVESKNSKCACASRENLKRPAHTCDEEENDTDFVLTNSDGSNSVIKSSDSKYENVGSCEDCGNTDPEDYESDTSEYQSASEQPTNDGTAAADDSDDSDEEDVILYQSEAQNPSADQSDQECDAESTAAEQSEDERSSDDEQQSDDEQTGDEQCDDETESDAETAPSLPPRLARQNAIATYPSPEFFKKKHTSACGHNAKAQPKGAIYSDISYYYDATNDFELFEDESSYVCAGKPTRVSPTYHFPNKRLVDIDQVVDFWETDFQVGDVTVTRMGAWESRGIVPDLNTNKKDYCRYIACKCLYKKWTDCSKSTDRWYEKYWGTSLFNIVNLKQKVNKKRFCKCCDSGLTTPVEDALAPSADYTQHESFRAKRVARRKLQRGHENSCKTISRLR